MLLLTYLVHSESGKIISKKRAMGKNTIHQNVSCFNGNNTKFCSVHVTIKVENTEILGRGVSRRGSTVSKWKVLLKKGSCDSLII